MNGNEATGDPPMPETAYRVTAVPEKSAALLSVLRNALEMTDREWFLAGCRELLASGQPNLVIDLRGLRRIFSVFIGSVLDVNARARSEGRRLTVLTSEPVAQVFRSVAGAETLNLDDGVSIEERARRKTSSRRRSPAG